MDDNFWAGLDRLIADNKMVIERPRGTAHPRYPHMRYPVDYGYLAGTCGGDGAELDIFRGSGDTDELVAVACTVDLTKKDSELKLLIGCNDKELQVVSDFLNNSQYMAAIIVKRKTASW